MGHGEIPDRGVGGYYVRDCICGQDWVFIQARGQQDTSDIYRFDDMSAEVVKFFLNTASFIFEHELKRKKKTGGEGLGPLGTSALMTDVL